jgi:glycosyltransferase involved in cell wall biosynthesis
MLDLISVIIPTHKRPHLVPRAVKSALTQTLKSIEVIVVVDGPDSATVEVLEQIDDSRLKVMVLPTNVRLAGARNAGVQAAQGTWIAFLDDDDEWLPEKLERQLEVAKRSSYACPIVVSQFTNRTPKGDFIWPRRLPKPSEHLSEYLFVRHSLFRGEGAILPSTYFTRRELSLKTPFENNKHEDYDWLLRVIAQHQEVGIEYIAESLAIWHTHIGIGQQRLSQIPNWQHSLEWVRSARRLITPRAYSSFVMTHVGSPAAAQQDWAAFAPLLLEAMRWGNPRPHDFLLYLSMWLIPQDLRQQIRAIVTRKQPQLTSSDPYPGS